MSSSVYVPVAPVAAEAGVQRTAVAGLAGKVVGIIDNTKNNFDLLADALTVLLQRDHGVKEVVRHRKRFASIPAPQDMLADVAGRCDVVLTGLGD